VEDRAQGAGRAALDQEGEAAGLLGLLLQGGALEGREQHHLSIWENLVSANISGAAPTAMGRPQDHEGVSFMAKTDSTATVTTTVACDLGRHSSCRKVVLTLTTAGTVDCTCPCHGLVQDLPDAWKAMAALTPPCDQDVDLAPIEDQELDDLLDREADRQLENDWIGAWS
jgi:hypothetical protein